MRVALVKPPATYADWYRRPVLGLAYMASYLEANGHDCTIFDAYYHGWSEEELLSHVRAYKPDVVGFSAMTHEVKKAAGIAENLKKDLKVPMIIGGCHLTALPARTLEQFPVFDYGVRGEAEGAMLRVVECLEKQDARGLQAVRGLIFRESGRVVVNEQAPFLTPAELDALPLPLFDDYYGDSPDALKPKDACYVLIGNRGCPFRCSFCMRVMGDKPRRRSAESICNEMEHAIKKYSAHTFDFYDDILIYDSSDTRELLGMMIDRGFPERIRWSALTRADLVRPDIIALAKRAGCFRVGIGVESGDDAILKVTGKGTTVVQVKEAIRILTDAGLAVHAYFILGHPDETKETARRTMDLATSLKVEMIAVGLMVPYPGTKVFDWARRGECGYRLLSEDWSEYDKYGGKVLEIEGLPYAQLAKWQRDTIIKFYLKNFKVRDGARYFWTRRRALKFLLKQKISALLPRSQAK